MRVAFKKFRYMVESLAPLRGRTTSKQLKAMNAFQGSMGDIQDAEVLLAYVQAYARNRGIAGEASLARALEELLRRRMILIETFFGSVDTVFIFWKPTSKVNGVRLDCLSCGMASRLIALARSTKTTANGLLPPKGSGGCGALPKGSRRRDYPMI